MQIKGIQITKKRVLLIIGLIILIIFLFNLIRHNSSTDTPDESVKKNVDMISSYDYSSVTDVQSQVEAKNQSHPVKSQEGSSGMDRSKYKGIFQNCVVVGDSITEGLSVYGFLSEGQVFCKVGGSILKDQSLFTNASGTYPKHAFFTFGMNDIGNYRGDPDAFVKDYKALLTKFRKASPKSKLYVNSISTPSKKAQKKKPVLKNYKKFNAALRKMCQQMNIPYIDNSFILAEHPDYYGSDGIHVSPGYYALWLKQMILTAGL